MRFRCILYPVFLFISSISFASSFSTFQTRALWVTRWDYRSPADVKQIFENAAASRFNTILFQVRGNGTTFFKSDLEPWAKELGTQNPDWDPLQLAVELAQLHRMHLQAWINVYPAWQGDDPPAQNNQLYQTRPDWFMVDQAGRRQKANDQYWFLSPTHPEVTPYLVGIGKEILTRYPVDGIHLDYVRFPGPAYSFDPPSVAQFKIEYGIRPDQDPYLWYGYRRQAITNFIEALYREMHLRQPLSRLTASVLGDYSEGYRVYLQDSHEWLARGIVDAIFPMIYTRNNQRFRRQLADHRLNDHRRHVYPGIYIADPENLQDQLQIAQELGCQGVALFSYTLLYPHHQLRAEFRELLQSRWPDEAQPSTMPWRENVRDTQGPVVQEAYTLPMRVYSNTQFKIAARISDPSGVYDDKTGSNGQGIYLLYDRVWPPDKGKEVRLSALKNRAGWYITDEPLASENAGLDFRFRIFAWDDFHESAGHPKRNLGFSDVWSLCILSPKETFRSNGQVGPELWDPTAISMDLGRKIWVISRSGSEIEIIDPNGLPCRFSPLRQGLNDKMNKEPLTLITGLTFCPPNVICVSSESKKRLYRFDATSGEPLPSIELTFQPGEMACDEAGHLFVLEQGSSRWHILTSMGIELVGSPLGLDHTGNDIAVLKDASRIFISDRSTSGVQCWHGAIEGYRARYWREKDLPAVDVGWAGIASDRADYVYVPHSYRGTITIFNRAGKPVEYLVGGSPDLNAPQDITVSAGGDTLYVIEATGSGPTRLHQWIKNLSNGN